MKKYRQAVAAMVLKPSGVCLPDGCGKAYSILLVHKPRTRDAWQLPQGGLEAGETASEAALRELYEEAGLKLPNVDFVSSITYKYDFPPEFVRRHTPVNAGQVLSFVVLEAKDPLITVDRNEIDSYAWVTPLELPKYLERKAYLDIVEKVLTEYESR